MACTNPHVVVEEAAMKTRRSPARASDTGGVCATLRLVSCEGPAGEALTESHAMRLGETSETPPALVDRVGGLVERIGDNVAGHRHDLDGGAGSADRERDDATAAQADSGGQDQQQASRFEKVMHALILSARRTIGVSQGLRLNFRP